LTATLDQEVHIILTRVVLTTLAIIKHIPYLMVVDGKTLLQMAFLAYMLLMTLAREKMRQLA
jgi:hypothetical protein